MSYCNFFGWFQFLQVTTSQNVFACKFTKNELCIRFYYKVGQGFLQVGRCYKMGQFLLQSWAGITKWDNYYKAGQSNNHFHYNNFVRVTYGFNFEPLRFTAWKVSKYGVFSGLCFAAFGLNSERYSVYLSVFSPNAGNTDQKKLHIWTFFTQCLYLRIWLVAKPWYLSIIDYSFNYW